MKKLNLQLFAATKEQSEASASEVSAAKPFDGLSE